MNWVFWLLLAQPAPLPDRPQFLNGKIWGALPFTSRLAWADGFLWGVGSQRGTLGKCESNMEIEKRLSSYFAEGDRSGHSVGLAALTVCEITPPEKLGRRE